MPVSDQQVQQWLAQNPGATPQQIASAMQQYGVDIGQLGRVTGQSGQALIQQANQAGMTNQQLAGMGIIAPMDIATTGTNLANAKYAGAISPGVLAAYQASVMGQSDPSSGGYTAADLAEAQKYQQQGYWGPSGSGNALTELRNAGVVPQTGYVPPWAGRSAAQMRAGGTGGGGMLGSVSSSGDRIGGPIMRPPPGQAGYPNMGIPSGQGYSLRGYGNQGMFGGTATSRMPYTSYQVYQPYQGYQRTQGMFGAPTMNYNMRNQPWQPNQQQGVPPPNVARRPGTWQSPTTGTPIGTDMSIPQGYSAPSGQTPFNQSYSNTGIAGGFPSNLGWSQMNPWSY